MSDVNKERGPKGDHGQHGETGEQGRQGEPGLVSQGERGRTGDRGMTGDVGQQGRQGEPGLVGRGERGPTGDRGQTGDAGTTGTAGKAGPDPTRKLLFLFVFLTIIATTYGIVLQQAINGVNENTARIERERVEARYESCLNSLTVLTEYNAQQKALGDVDRRALARSSDPELITLWTDRIKIYDAGLVSVPDCEALKPTGTG